MNKKAYQWQGEPVETRFGYVLQQENKEKPMYWYNFECFNKQKIDDSFEPDHFVRDNGNHFSLISAIEVTQHGQTFLLANHCGIGVHKLLNGGWPNYAHFSLSGKFEEDPAPYFAIKKFNLEEYESHESERRKWQKKEYPEQFEKMERLRNSFIKRL